MAWFFSKRKPKGQQPSSEVLDTGSHRSPGLEMVAAALLTHARHSVLDLGASSTHNVELFSRLTDDVMVAGLFQSCVGSEGRSGHRSRPFRFDDSVLEILPEAQEQFGAVLLWDLAHYFDAELFDRFTERLEECLEPGAMIYLMASNNAPVPLTPISFQVEPGRLRYGKLESCSLHYQVPEGERSTDLRLLTRDIERRMARFRPQRLFQLRNGYQEFVFRKAGERRTRSAPAEAGEKESEPPAPPPAPGTPRFSASTPVETQRPRPIEAGAPPGRGSDVGETIRPATSPEAPERSAEEGAPIEQSPHSPLPESTAATGAPGAASLAPEQLFIESEATDDHGAVKPAEADTGARTETEADRGTPSRGRSRNRRRRKKRRR